MRADADEAARRFAAAGIATPGPESWRGIAQLLSGDPEGAEASFDDAIRTGREVGVAGNVADSLCELAVLAIARGNWSRAEALVSQARAAAPDDGIESVFVSALAARAALQRGDVAAARKELVTAQRRRPLVTYAYPYLAVQIRIELTRAHLSLGDVTGARTLMREIDEVLRRRPDLGTLVSQAQELRAQLAAQRSPHTAGASALTAAELRMLPLLATHLTYPEIAAELFVSKNTIKSQAYSLFRKLGASTRSQAVARSRELALLEG